MSKRQKQEMTRKEALAVLHKIYDAVGRHLYAEGASKEEVELKGQAYAAFQILDVAFHGKQATYYAHGLCHLCYLHTGMEDILVHAKGKLFREPCCTACFEQLKAENKIESMSEWNGDEWVKKEVVE